MQPTASAATAQGLTHASPTGPFANYTNSIGPGYQITNHCIDRRINDAMSALSSQSQVDACLKLPEFKNAWPAHRGREPTQRRPRRCRRSGEYFSQDYSVPSLIFGTPKMGNGVSSPGDPVFYLHHAWLDKIFWDWQKEGSGEADKNNHWHEYRARLCRAGFPPRPSSIPYVHISSACPGSCNTQLNFPNSLLMSHIQS